MKREYLSRIMVSKCRICSKSVYSPTVILLAFWWCCHCCYWSMASTGNNTMMLVNAFSIHLPTKTTTMTTTTKSMATTTKTTESTRRSSTSYSSSLFAKEQDSQSSSSSSAMESAVMVEWEPVSDLQRRIEEGIHYEYVPEDRPTKDNQQQQCHSQTPTTPVRGVFCGYRGTTDERLRLKSANPNINNQESSSEYII